MHGYNTMQGYNAGTLIIAYKCVTLFNCHLFQGPAYSIETVNLENYVKAIGSHKDWIATYEFKVAFTASHVVWKHTFATSNETNDVSFRIDDGDWYMWRPPHKGSHALWTEYYFQVQPILCLIG